MAENLDIIIQAINRASGTINQVNRDLNGLSGQGTKTGGILGKALGAGLVAAAAAGAAAVGALAGVVIKSTKAAMDMEAQMSAIASILGKTKDEIEPLNKLILDLGMDPTLKVSATEAADAIQMLARNGLDMTQIMDGAARSTVLLANATGAEFGTAADIATDVMAQFKIGADQMGGVVDQISGVVNNSKFSINDYQLAIAQAGGVAASVGVEFEDFNASIATISPLFASGSDAGTSFKVFLQRLIPTTNKSADMMRSLGLYSGLTGSEFDKLTDKIAKTQKKIEGLDPTAKNYDKRLTELNATLAEQQAQLVGGNSAFFDAQGNLNSMQEVAAALQGALANLSEEQKNEALQTIFGTDAMRAAVALADAGAEGFGRMNEALAASDAQAAAATRMDNLSGSMEILSGIVETLQLRIGDKFIPVFRQVVDTIANFLSEHSDELVAWFGTIADKVANAITWFQSIFATTKNVTDAFSLLPKPIQVMATWINLNLVPALKDLYTWFADNVLPILKDVWKFLTVDMMPIWIQLGRLIGTILVEQIKTLTAFLKFFWDTILIPLASFINDVVIEKFGSWKNIIDGVAGAIGTLVGWISTMADKVRGAFDWTADIPSWLIPGSPTPFELGIRGIDDAIQSLSRTIDPFSLDIGGGMATAGAGASAGAYSNTYNMTFNGGGSPSDTAYAVQDAILRTQRRRGY